MTKEGGEGRRRWRSPCCLSLLCFGLVVFLLVAARFAWTVFSENHHQSTTTVIEDFHMDSDLDVIIEPEHRNLQGTCPRLDQEGTQSLALTRGFVQRMNLTLSYQFLMLEQNPKARNVPARYNLDYYKFWKEINDATLIARQDARGEDPGVCHAVFRATITPYDFLDNAQNLYPFPDTLDGSDCLVRDGFKSGLFTSYYGRFRQSLYECVDGCIATTGQRCPLVFSGLSQAGGVGVIASIVFRELNPMVISFGCMHAIAHHKGYPCNDLHRTRHFRFTTSNDAGEYDGIANLRYPPNMIHTGHSIYMDESTNYPLLYLGVDEDKDRFPLNFDIHFRDEYQIRIDQMLAYPDECYPIPLGKWPVGHVCGYNDECANNNCINKRCSISRLSRGQTCKEDADCASGRCRRGRWYALEFRKKCRGG